MPADPPHRDTGEAQSDPAAQPAPPASDVVSPDSTTPDRAPGSGLDQPDSVPPTGLISPGSPPYGWLGPGQGGWPPGYGLPGYGLTGYAAPSWPPAYGQGWPPVATPQDTSAATPTPPGYAPEGWSYRPPGFGPWMYGAAPGQGWAQPAYGQWGGWAPGAYSQPGYGGWGYAPSPWGYPYGYGYGYAPWGFPYPGSFEPPGRFHPAVAPRPVNSLQGRVAPRMYAAGWLLSLAGLGILVALIAAGIAGIIREVELLTIAGLAEIAFVALTAGLAAAAAAQGSQRRADGWQDYFGPSPFLVTGAWLALTTAASLPLIGLVGYLNMRLATSVETLFLLLVNVAGYVGLVQLLVVRPGALSWRDMARPKHLAPDPNDLSAPVFVGAYPLQGAGAQSVRALGGDILLGLALSIPFLIATLFLAGILASLLGMSNAESSGPTPTYLPGWDLWITLMAAAVIAPIGEEIFFRGFATNAWARSLRRDSALIRAAIFFAVIHVIDVTSFDNLSIFVRASILAVAVRIPVAWALSWIYTRRHSIFASATLHAAYNGSLVLLVWWVSTNYTSW